jgi:mRNA-degrading endonuclease toxin of MazEF toxin-antitoxin module
VNLNFGDIVIVSSLLDPRGRNPKDRPAVVVTPSEDINKEKFIYVVAISTSFPDPLPEDHVAIPWQRPRHPRTGLNERNAAVCHWVELVDRDQIDRVLGRVPNAELARIQEILERLFDES